jgi:hypothetical protein
MTTRSKREPGDGKREKKPVHPRLEIHRMLAVSTGNLVSATKDWLDQYMNPLPNRMDECVITIYGKSEYGWFIPIVDPGSPDEPQPWENKEIPRDLRRVMRFAHQNNCTWIMFDRDADLLPGFNVYKD